MSINRVASYTAAAATQHAAQTKNAAAEVAPVRPAPSIAVALASTQRVALFTAVAAMHRARWARCARPGNARLRVATRASLTAAGRASI